MRVHPPGTCIRAVEMSWTRKEEICPDKQVLLLLLQGSPGETSPGGRERSRVDFLCEPWGNIKNTAGFLVQMTFRRMWRYVSVTHTHLLAAVFCFPGNKTLKSYQSKNKTQQECVCEVFICNVCTCTVCACVSPQQGATCKLSSNQNRGGSVLTHSEVILCVCVCVWLELSCLSGLLAPVANKLRWHTNCWEREREARVSLSLSLSLQLSLRMCLWASVCEDDNICYWTYINTTQHTQHTPLSVSHTHRPIQYVITTYRASTLHHILITPCCKS